VEYVLGYVIIHEAMFPSSRGVIIFQIVIFFVFFLLPPKLLRRGMYLNANGLLL